MAGHALGLSHPRDLFLSLPQPRLPEIDGGRREKAEMLTLRNRDDFGTTEIRLALTGALSVALYNAVGEGHIVPVGNRDLLSQGFCNNCLFSFFAHSNWRERRRVKMAKKRK